MATGWAPCSTPGPTTGTKSFVLQYLSPALMRKMRLFVLGDEANESYYQVASIHDERGYERIRSSLAKSLDVSAYQPDIQVVDVDLLGDRRLGSTTPCMTACCSRSRRATRR